MDCDRRDILAGLIMAGLLPACAKASSPVRTRFALLDGRFMTAEGRIVDTGNGGISHSEGQGYAMILAEAAGDQAVFDRLWGWTRATLMRPDGLFSWRFDPRTDPAVGDPNNATDGDILIAWALARAGARWRDKNYADESARIRAAVRTRLIRNASGMTVLLPALVGFTSGATTTINPSYYVWPALDAFRRLDGNRAWGALIADGQKLMQSGRFGPAQLPTDWIELRADGTLAPAAGKPPRFGFDAVRVPLYLAWSGRSALLAPFRAFWRSFTDRQQPIPAWIDVVTGERAPYPLSRGGRAIADLTLGGPATGDATGEDYFSSALLGLSAVARAAGR